MGIGIGIGTGTGTGTGTGRGAGTGTGTGTGTGIRYWRILINPLSPLYYILVYAAELQLYRSTMRRTSIWIPILSSKPITRPIWRCE